MSKVWVINRFDVIPHKYRGREIKLLTHDELDSLPDGTLIVSIMGQERVKGVDKIDEDTRGGYLAYGLLVEEVLSDEEAWNEVKRVVDSLTIHQMKCLFIVLDSGMSERLHDDLAQIITMQDPSFFATNTMISEDSSEVPLL